MPQVYAVVKADDPDGSGALLAATGIGLSLSGDLTNSGRISSRQSTQVVAENINNLNGQLRADELTLKAQTDINKIHLNYLKVQLHCQAEKRFTMDCDGNVHRFMADGTGNFHWAGSTAG